MPPIAEDVRIASPEVAATSATPSARWHPKAKTRCVQFFIKALDLEWRYTTAFGGLDRYGSPIVLGYVAMPKYWSAGTTFSKPHNAIAPPW